MERFHHNQRRSTPFSKPRSINSPHNHSRPTPRFTDSCESPLFQFKSVKSVHSRAMLPKSPVKSAPPVSRVFPYRKWAPEKAHAVSFRSGEAESPYVDSALYSRYYDSESSELYFEQCFKLEKKLGEGSFGEVMKVRSLDDGKHFALKRSREKFRSEADRRRKLDEVKKHEQLPEHPNCVKFIKAWEEKHRLYIQTELCSMSLKEFFESNRNISEIDVWRILIDLLRGLNHIHTHGFIHLDIKPDNIFLSDCGKCKIGDFGLVIDNTDMAHACEGDNKYMAPELLTSVFSAKADVFSLGIAMLELATDVELPADGLPWQLLRQGYMPQECYEVLSHDLCSTIRWMMTPDPNDRPTTEEVLRHPLITSKRQKLFPLEVSDWIASQCARGLWFAVCILSHILIQPFKILFHSVTFSNKPSKGTTPHSSEENSVSTNKWESSDSSNLDIFSKRSESVFFTPNVQRSYAHMTPSPRNSSPVSTRAVIRAVANLSPDVSPLSYAKHENYHMRSSLSRSDRSSLNDVLYDSSDGFNDSVFSSKPRNLLEMLNNVSDSD